MVQFIPILFDITSEIFTSSFIKISTDSSLVRYSGRDNKESCRIDRDTVEIGFGSVMVESVFGWPGLGTYFLEAALFRDFPFLMAINTIFPFLFLVSRLLTDITYVFIDPRIKY